MNIDENAFAKVWVESWNSHDLDKILSHYSDDFEITTPMIKVALGINTGTLKILGDIGQQHLRKCQTYILN
jgi:ketosteroid isomerase-like protein